MEVVLLDLPASDPRWLRTDGDEGDLFRRDDDEEVTDVVDVW